MRDRSITFGPTLQSALQHALQHLESIDDRSIGATVDLAQLRARFDRPLLDTGLAPTQVIDELVRDVEGGIIGNVGGRFFGWVIGGSLPAALAADWLTSTWDQNAAIHACGPAEAVIEEVAGSWLKRLFGLPDTASFAFVTGTQMAHLTCLAAARHRLLMRAGWDVEQDGMAGAPPIRLITSRERHGSIDRAARMLGLGTRAISALPCDAQGRLDPESLAAAFETSPAQPTIAQWRRQDHDIAHGHGATETGSRVDFRLWHRRVGRSRRGQESRGVAFGRADDLRQANADGI